MNRAIVPLAFVSAGILSIGFMVPATQASTVVRFDLNCSVSGTDGPINYFDVELFDTAAPVTVANFLQYVNNGLYNNTIIHRDAKYPNGAPFVLQGGGFKPTVEEGIVTALTPLAPYDPIQNEFSAARSNLTGTIAMAKTSDPDSATSQWFVNLNDNSASLDDPANSGGFTVFGQVLGEGMTLINAIDGLPAYDISQDYGIPFNEVPMFNDGASFIVVTRASIVPEPSTLGLFGMGAIGLLVFLGFRRSYALRLTARAMR